MIDLDFARSVLKMESEAIEGLVERIGSDFQAAVETLLGCRGLIVVTGIGKALLVGQKISATLASTGSPSFDLHAAEALHGDLGRIRPGDVLVAISNSGKSREVLSLCDQARKIVKPGTDEAVRIIAMTGQADSPLGKLADIVLEIGKLPEACPLGLAPSTTTTAMLALGDALALTLQKARRFTKEEYALFHPGGELGRSLMKVEEIMRTDENVPTIRETATVREAVVVTSKARAGAVCVIDDGGRLLGIFTNGDLGRQLAAEPNVDAKHMAEVMTPSPKSVQPDQLASEAFRTLRQFRIDELPVVDKAGVLVGLIDIQDFLDWHH